MVMIPAWEVIASDGPQRFLHAGTDEALDWQGRCAVGNSAVPLLCSQYHASAEQVVEGLFAVVPAGDHEA